MSRRDSIPSSDSGLIDFARNLQIQVEEHHLKWNLVEFPQAIKDALENFEQKVRRCQDPNRGPVDIKDKSMAKKVLEKEVRPFVQGFIARNPLVSDRDRVALHLPPRDTTPTPILTPTGQAAVTFTYPGSAQLVVQISLINPLLHDARSNYGCRIYYGVYDAGETPPENGEDLRHSLFTRKKKVLLNFRPEDSRKIAWFCVRYENSKGEAGPWSPMYSTVIP